MPTYEYECGACGHQFEKYQSMTEKPVKKCPECGKDVKTAKKSWKMAGKPDKAGKRTQLTIGLFECCGKTFRQVLEKKKI